MHVRSYIRLLIALFVAPLLAPFAVPLGTCLSELIGNGGKCSAAVFGYAWYGLLPAVAATVLLGGPCFSLRCE